MTSVAAQTPTPADDETAELREHLAFQRAEARTLRAAAARLAHELSLARRLLANLVPDSSTQGWPEVAAAVPLPGTEFGAEAADLCFALDNVERGAAHTRVRGWAFAPGQPDRGAGTAILLLLPVAGGGVPYAVATATEARPDVAAAFAGLSPAPPANLDRAGFDATVFHPSVAPGEYELCLHVEQPGAGAARRATGVRLVF